MKPYQETRYSLSIVKYFTKNLQPLQLTTILKMIITIMYLVNTLCNTNTEI